MENSIARKHPELVSEWSPRNKPLTPDDVAFNSFLWKQVPVLLRYPDAQRIQ